MTGARQSTDGRKGGEVLSITLHLSFFFFVCVAMNAEQVN